MTTVVRAAQLAPQQRDVAGNIGRAAELVRSAAHADLVALPELFVSGYQLDRLEPLALTPDDPAFTPLREAAREAQTGVVVGFAERFEHGVANSALCLDASGMVAGVYRKTHLFGQEVGAFVAGDQLQPIELAGRRLGVMICFDVEFPEVARTLVLRGADLLLTISANMEPYAVDHAVYARSRGLENAVPHVYVNRPGQESGFLFVGETFGMDEHGAVVGSLGAESGLVDLAIGPAAGRTVALDYLSNRRPELYAYREELA